MLQIDYFSMQRMLTWPLLYQHTYTHSQHKAALIIKQQSQDIICLVCVEVK